ncbi:MAG TPA: restriction endonuclease, partial [Candidatus Cloacimonas sp.]|nr:restriction endonuclease [Candidatus Cloacimonas sp.]
PEIRSYIKNNINSFYYNLKIDVPVYIDDELVMAIECKSYTENAMLKRVLVDFTLLKTQYPVLDCILLQLESQLTGDYSNISQSIIFGSSSTHTLLSYFDVDLYIITLLQGERNVNKPIHKKEYFKELTSESTEKAISTFQNILYKHKKKSDKS